jgi:hypothetical protein
MLEKSVALLFIFLALCSCSKETTGNQDTVSTDHAPVVIPSPAEIQLVLGGRFEARYQGNIKYLQYQYEHYGSFMLEAFATRHYAPGKLLERMWDGDCAGKWLDAATRADVNTGDDTLLSMVDHFAGSLLKHQHIFQDLNPI